MTVPDCPAGGIPTQEHSFWKDMGCFCPFSCLPPSPQRLIQSQTCSNERLLIEYVKPSALLLLLLLLSRFSSVQLCATPETAAHQASPSLGFSRQEHWSGLPFPSPMHESEKWKWSRSVMSQLLATPWTAAYQVSLSMGFSRQEYWSWVSLPSPYPTTIPLFLLNLYIKQLIGIIIWQLISMVL